MAEAKKKADGGEDLAEPPKKPNKKRLLIIIVAAVVALVLIGGGAAFFLMKKKPAAGEEDGEDPVAAQEHGGKAKAGTPDAPPVFVKLEAFTVKLQSEGVDAYLQAVPELRVLDAVVGEKIKLFNAEIRHRVLLILAGKKASDLATPEGMQRLSNEMRVAMNQILAPPVPRKKGAKEPVAEEPSDRAGPEDPVQAVLFTSFIVQ